MVLASFVVSAQNSLNALSFLENVKLTEFVNIDDGLSKCGFELQTVQNEGRVIAYSYSGEEYLVKSLIFSDIVSFVTDPMERENVLELTTASKEQRDAIIQGFLDLGFLKDKPFQDGNTVSTIFTSPSSYLSYFLYTANISFSENAETVFIYKVSIMFSY